MMEVTGPLRRSGYRTDALFCLILLSLITFSPASALVDGVTSVPPSSDLPARDRPDLISALKTHVAYVGQTQEARMDGIIGYVGSISHGEGVHTLEEIEIDYLVIASSIPLMNTADEITEARGELRVQSQLFADEAKIQVLKFNGTTEDMRRAISITVSAFDASLSNVKETLWLGKDTARMTVFNKEAQHRTILLRSFEDQGIDTTIARNISLQIDSRKSELQNALSSNSVVAVNRFNSGIREQDAEFRSLILGYQESYYTEMKRSALLARTD